MQDSGRPPFRSPPPSLKLAAVTNASQSAAHSGELPTVILSFGDNYETQRVSQGPAFAAAALLTASI